METDELWYRGITTPNSKLLIECPWCYNYTQIPDAEEAKCPICSRIIKKEDIKYVYATITPGVNKKAVQTEVD